jgi:allantoinase
VIDFGLGGGIVVSYDDLNELQAVAEFGAPYFKVFMPADPPVDTALLWASVQVAARTGLRLALHAEETACLDPSVAWDNPRGFAQARPLVAETSATAQVLEMALAAGAPVHICHVSAGRTADLIDSYRGWGAEVTAETTPHFLIFEESDFERLGSRLKTTPPLRQAADCDLLWQALRDGVLGAVVSDHYLGDLPVPGKAVKGMREREAGIAGLEVSLPLLYDAAVGQGRLSLQRFVEVTSQGPSRISGFDFCKGSIATGMDADLVIFDPQADWTPAVVPFSRLSETPYEDRKMRGRVEYTIVRGATVWDGKEICAAQGTGKYIGAKRRPNPLH